MGNVLRQKKENKKRKRVLILAISAPRAIFSSTTAMHWGHEDDAGPAQRRHDSLVSGRRWGIVMAAATAACTGCALWLRAEGAPLADSPSRAPCRTSGREKTADMQDNMTALHTTPYHMSYLPIPSLTHIIPCTVCVLLPLKISVDKSSRSYDLKKHFFMYVVCNHSPGPSVLGDPDPVDKI